MTSLAVFDDRQFSFEDSVAGAPDLSPATDLRASFEIRTGVVTTLERILREWPGQRASLWAPPDIADLVDARTALPVNTLTSEDPHVLCVNGRWSYPAASFDLAPGQAIIESQTQSIVATLLEREQAMSFLTSGTLPGSIERLAYDGQLLINRPWHIVAMVSQILQSDLARHEMIQRAAEQPAEPPPGVTVFGTEPAAIHPEARLCPNVTIDVENGPVLIDRGVTVRPGTIIVGPAYVGPGSTVNENTIIKANSVIGPVCKIAGEVGGTIFQGYANKAHDGHLGDSYIGEWVNIGAGTTNSNLLNTYGEVVTQQHPRSHHERTGMMYLGAIVGDHAKFAINSRIMTGSIIGTGAMMASSYPVPACVEPFSWITDRQMHLYRFDKFIHVAEIVLSRRGLELSDAMRARLKSLHDAVSTS